MGLIKRMLRRTSRKLLDKIVPPRHSHELVLNPPANRMSQSLSSATTTTGATRYMSSSIKRTATTNRSRKSKKKEQASIIPEALLMAAKNCLPPVQFHHVHGPTVRLSKNMCVARRTQSFCHALVFSNRVILPNERVYIKVLDIAKGWSGTIRFGFTSVDPATLAYQMPKHVCPDMTEEGHTWARALADEVVRRNSVIHFSYNRHGFIHYGINNQDCGIFHGNVNTSQNLWFVVDVYGLTSAVELIDPRVHNATSELDYSQIDDELGLIDRSTMFKSTSAMDEIFRRYESASARAKKKRARKLLRETAALRGATNARQWAQLDHHGGSLITDSIAMRRFNDHQIEADLPNLNSILLPAAQQNIYSPMPGMAVTNNDRIVSTTRALNDPHDYHQINMSTNNTSATYANESQYQPISSNRSTNAPFSSSTTNVSAVSSSAANSSPASCSSGANRSTRTISDEHEISHRLDCLQLTTSADRSTTNQKSAFKPSKSIPTGSQTPVAAARRRILQQDNSSNVQTNLKRGSIETNNKQQTPRSMIAHRMATNSQLSSIASPNLHAKTSTSTKVSNAQTQQQAKAAKARHSIKTQKCATASSNSSSRDNNNSPPSKDCPICFERPINCVLYQCGHMCTCYECGVKQWRTQSRTCPICRTIIKDVIKTYMS